MNNSLQYKYSICVIGNILGIIVFILFIIFNFLFDVKFVVDVVFSQKSIFKIQYFIFGGILILYIYDSSAINLLTEIYNSKK